MPELFAEQIKIKAEELGFSKVGIACAEPLTIERKHLLEWLNLGYNASMEWMARDIEKRIDPHKVVPNAKSVICVALNYYSSFQPSSEPTIGKISRYACGSDYHIVMMKRMERLFSFINSVIPNINGKIYVDTGSVMEKAWAVRAGIGWMGKHSNIITREYGSWVFLGEIIIDVELDYDKPVLDRCGTCTACIDACPTQALVQPYVLDADKCISYLTIEHRGDLPNELTPKFQNWIYGCDICQEVCPWNRFQRETNEPEFQPREENTALQLSELANITQEEFSRRFRNSAVKRTKRIGLARNANSQLTNH